MFLVIIHLRYRSKDGLGKEKIYYSVSDALVKIEFCTIEEKHEFRANILEWSGSKISLLLQSESKKYQNPEMTFSGSKKKFKYGKKKTP